jgi:hypothetical protein
MSEKPFPVKACTTGARGDALRQGTWAASSSPTARFGTRHSTPRDPASSASSRAVTGPVRVNPRIGDPSLFKGRGTHMPVYNGGTGDQGIGASGIRASNSELRGLKTMVRWGRDELGFATPRSGSSRRRRPGHAASAPDRSTTRSADIQRARAHTAACAAGAFPARHHLPPRRSYRRRVAMGPQPSRELPIRSRTTGDPRTKTRARYPGSTRSLLQGQPDRQTRVTEIDPSLLPAHRDRARMPCSSRPRRNHG